jgi:hypothetical protein
MLSTHPVAQGRCLLIRTAHDVLCRLHRPLTLVRVTDLPGVTLLHVLWPSICRSKDRVWQWHMPGDCVYCTKSMKPSAGSSCRSCAAASPWATTYTDLRQHPGIWAENYGKSSAMPCASLRLARLPVHPATAFEMECSSIGSTTREAAPPRPCAGRLPGWCGPHRSTPSGSQGSTQGAWEPPGHGSCGM